MSTKSDARSISSFGMSSYYQSTSPTTGAYGAYDAYSMEGSSAPTNTNYAVPTKRYVQNPGNEMMERVDDLQRQVQQLSEENRSLAAMHPPPAYR